MDDPPLPFIQHHVLELVLFADGAPVAGQTVRLRKGEGTTIAKE
jgi:hypothetical protein